MALDPKPFKVISEVRYCRSGHRSPSADLLTKPRQLKNSRKQCPTDV
jgi:hypothetical protein